jgi:hypothetical protein
MPAAIARSPWDRALTLTLIIFALAATWSIAIAQIGIVATALLVSARRLTGRDFENGDVQASGNGKGRALPATLLVIGGYLLLQAISIPLGVHPGRSLGAFAGSWVLLFPALFWFALRDDTTREVTYRALLIGAALAGVYGAIGSWPRGTSAT